MKIGVTGIANGGKTVFLTSLLWQLAELESSDFRVFPSIGLHGFRPLRLENNTENLFPFEKYRETLSRGRRWPAKTTDSYRYSCEIRRKDWEKISVGKLTRMRRFQFSNRQRLDFFDFPGERIADAAIAAFENYADWCDHIIHHFKSHSDYLAAVLPYLEMLEQLVQVENREYDVVEKVVRHYKVALAGLIHGYKPLISPSTFLLDRTGTVAEMVSVEELASSRVAGLTAETQFAPLPSDVREAYPELAQKMEYSYTAYRNELAWPLFKEVIESQRLVILVDIPSLLAGGVGRYNDNRQILIDLFESLEPNGILGTLLHKLQALIVGGLEKVSFVAVKSDLVLPDDVTGGRLESLLRQMTARIKSMLPEIEFGYFVCSAVHSTRAGEADNQLIGRLMRNNPDRMEMEFGVSSLPEAWPEDWKPGEFCFAEVLPEVPKCLMIPPKQVGLDQLFEFLLTSKGCS